LKKKSRWRINEDIRAPEVRVIGDEGKQVGVMPVSEALALSKSKDKDLVEIAPKAKPPVVKVVNFGKFKYAEEKKERDQKKKSKAAELKEVRLSPFIAEGDYNTRLRRINKFLKLGHKVRVVVVFKGRHMGSKPFGYKRMKEILDTVDHDVSIDMEPKFLGRHLAMVISPLKHRKVEQKNEKSEKK